ncbi:MAG: DUF4434 domain-containing protein [Candidatus Saccharimonadales bacterium]
MMSKKKTTTARMSAQQKAAQRRKRVSVHTFIIAAIALVVSFGLYAMTQRVELQVGAASCQKPNMNVSTNYPISGYFYLTSSDPCATQASVEGMHKIGADTVITFGSTLKEMSPSALKKDPLYRYFASSGKHGYDIAKSKTSGGRIAKVFTYSDKIIMGSAAHICGSRDGTIRTNKGVFDWFLIPTDAAYSGCTSPSKTYDLVVSSSKSTSDANTNLINSARQYGMKVYLGLPKVAMENDASKGPRIDYSHTFGSFSTRVLKSWQQLYGKNPAFAGVYQTQETVVSSKVGKRVLDLYALQHKVIAWQLQKDKRVVIISPYARMLKTSGTTLASITDASKRMGQTAKSAGVTPIIMPQDGAGTGHVGLYDPFEKNAKIRPEATPTVGKSSITNAAAYMGSTTDLYRAIKASGFTTWGNVEAFRPGGSAGNRPLTNRAKLDKKVRTAAPAVSKIVAYRWNGYMTDKSSFNGNMTLQQSILTNGNKPFISSASRISGGVRVVGYKLYTGKSAYIVVNSNGKKVRVAVSKSAVKTTLGGKLQYVDVKRPGLIRGKSVYIQASNGSALTQTLGFSY